MLKSFQLSKPRAQMVAVCFQTFETEEDQPHRHFQKREGTLSNCFYESILSLKHGKILQKKLKLQTNLTSIMFKILKILMSPREIIKSS